jgi:gliding motility-associated-like protein
MKTIILAIACLAISTCHAQQFGQKKVVDLPDSLITTEISWVDMDNDGLLDIVVHSNDSDGRKFFLFYKNDTTAGPQYRGVAYTNLVSSASILADADQDNDIDLIVTGYQNGAPGTIFLINGNAFSFSTIHVVSHAGSVVKLADLDIDGKHELILSGSEAGSAFFNVYKEKQTGWVIVNDSINIEAKAIEVFDFDNDGDNDVIVSGKDEDGTAITSILDNKRNFFLEEAQLTPAIDGNISIGDFDTDGFFDVILAGKNSGGAETAVLMRNGGREFNVAQQSLPVLKKTRYFVADFNSNGKPDVHVYGYNNAGDTINFLMLDDQAQSSLPHTGVTAYAFGDWEHDGDLDMVQSVSLSSGKKLIIYLNSPMVPNSPPGRPSHAVAAVILNRLFLYWEKSADDFTPAGSITYDVMMQTSLQELMVGEFDAINNKRLTVSHGNTGNTNYVLLKPLHTGPFGYAIQPVDNAFHAGSDGKSICFGTSRSCAPVTTLVEIEACKNEIVALTAPPNSLWFSFTSGLLTSHSSLAYNMQQPDTVFSVSDIGSACPAIKVYNIIVKEKLVRETNALQFICAGQETTFEVENGWPEVAWTSTLKGFISDQASIQFSTTVNDTLKVKLSNGDGCLLQRNTILKISEPEIVLNGQTFQIIRGEQVQLKATGGEEYLWMPEEGLNSAIVADPVATPQVTTQYTLTVKDSLGCEANANVLIIVEGTAFVPNLFTPNEDGKNDYFRVYGLLPLEDFSLAIYNRAGSLVYETKDVTEATQTGWDGTVSGNKQPNGVYYWNVKGQGSGGKHILLNGKTAGSIVLLR